LLILWKLSIGCSEFGQHLFASQTLSTLHLACIVLCKNVKN
jgi:hypothetical protein